MERVRRCWVTQVCTAASERKKPAGRQHRKLADAQEARLAAMACSMPPEGAARWLLALRADRLAELTIVDSIAHDTVRVTLKNEPKPWLKRARSIPPKDNAAFASRAGVHFPESEKVVVVQDA